VPGSIEQLTAALRASPGVELEPFLAASTRVPARRDPAGQLFLTLGPQTSQDGDSVTDVLTMVHEPPLPGRCSIPWGIPNTGTRSSSMSLSRVPAADQESPTSATTWPPLGGENWCSPSLRSQEACARYRRRSNLGLQSTRSSRGSSNASPTREGPGTEIAGVLERFRVVVWFRVPQGAADDALRQRGPCRPAVRISPGPRRNSVVIHVSITAAAIPEPTTLAPRQSTLLSEWDRARAAQNGISADHCVHAPDAVRDHGAAVADAVNQDRAVDLSPTDRQRCRVGEVHQIAGRLVLSAEVDDVMADSGEQRLELFLEPEP
jgi:hypothetical protein